MQPALSPDWGDLRPDLVIAEVEASGIQIIPS
jgi:hypothetical protein